MKKKIIAWLLAASVLMSMGWAIPFASAAGEIHVTQLLTNGVKEPEAIDPQAPVFTWAVESPKRGFLQQAYQIIVTEKLTGAEIWDSGKTESPASSAVEYKGPELHTDTSYLWKVRVWGQDGSVSAYSEPSSFRVGLNKEDWNAQYIWDGSENENNFAYFRKSFTIDGSKQVAEAVVYTSAHNDYQLFLNGERVGVGPARSNPITYGQYCAYDITDDLQAGKNAFAALAHWHGVWLDSGVNADPAYILEARIRYTDGTEEIIVTDDTWKVLKQTAYIEENPVYFGFHGGEKNRASIRYDARREPAGWKTVDFDNSAWAQAQEVDRSDYNLYAQLVGEEEEAERITPQRVYEENGTWFVEFDKTYTGWPELKLKENQAGDEVKVQYWEVERGWGDAGYDTYLCAGGEEMFYAPYVRHTSFKILEITGYAGTLTAEDVTGIVAYSQTENTGTFVSSDDRLNAVFTMSERSGRQNIQQGIISVDANREQSPWTADSWNIGIGCLYNHANTMLIDKIIKDYAGEQQEDGNFLTCSPGWQFVNPSPEWSMYWPMLLWQEYLFRGDLSLLDEMYVHLEEFMDYMQRFENPNSGLYNPPGWRISDYAGGELAAGGENIATNCQLYMNFTIAAEIARLLDNQQDAQHYTEKAEQLKDAINSGLLVDGERYATTPNHSQIVPLGTAWALRSGVVPAVFRDRVVRWLASQSNNYNVGGYGGDALYSGLYEAGLGQIATADFARYDTMLSKNNTNWESFGALSSENMGNHAWTAYPSYLLPKYVGGVTPTAGGFAQFRISPEIDGLTYAQTTTPTVKGEVAVSWEKVSDSEFAMTVTIPGNATAEICLPDHDLKGFTVRESGSVLYENGAYVSGVDGITNAVYTEDRIVVTAGSGTYEFTVTGTPKHTPSYVSVVLDNAQAQTAGSWMINNQDQSDTRYGGDFIYATSWGEEVTATATFTFPNVAPGTYQLYAWWTPHENRATDTPYTVKAGETTETVRFNQQQNGGKWNAIGTYTVTQQGDITVTIGNDANGYVIADAVKLETLQEEVEESEMEKLLLYVYEVGRTDLNQYQHPVKIQEFQDALQQARELCENEQATQEQAKAAYEALKTAYENLQQWKKKNLALHAAVSASESEKAGGFWDESYLTDGYLAQDNSGNIGYTSPVHEQQELEEPIVLTLDLREVKTVNAVALFPRVGSVSWEGKTANFMQDYQIQVSQDGQTFTTVRTVEDQPDPAFQAVELEFDAAQARCIRLVVTRLGEYAADEVGLNNPYRLQLSEVEVYAPIQQYQVSVDWNHEQGNVSGPTGMIPADGSSVTLTAEPKNGFRFVGWYEDETCVSTDLAYTFVVDRDISLQAVFESVLPEEPVDKTQLQQTYDYALTLSTEGVPSSAAGFFKNALDKAGQVLKNDNATQAEVDAARNDLLESIRGLELTPGDKEELNELIALAESMLSNEDQYVAAYWPQLTEALKAAQEMADDGDAVDSDIQSAAQALLDAILAQQLKADKSQLEDLLGKAEDMDLSGYTQESVDAFRTALQNAQAVLDDETLGEDQQNVVDEAVAQLSAAMDGLTAAEDQPGSTEEPDESNVSQTEDRSDVTEKPGEGNSSQTEDQHDVIETPSEDNVPQTGGRQIALWGVCAAAGALILAVRKGRRKAK